MSGFSKWRVVKHIKLSQESGYLRKMAYKSEMQDNRTNGKVIILVVIELGVSAHFVKMRSNQTQLYIYFPSDGNILWKSICRKGAEQAREVVERSSTSEAPSNL